MACGNDESRLVVPVAATGDATSASDDALGAEECSPVCASGADCVEGVCVAEEVSCAESAPVERSGYFAVQGPSATLDTSHLSEVALSANHKVDIDPEDQCLVRIEVVLSARFEGEDVCQLTLTGERLNAQGDRIILDGHLEADSFCPGFVDADEGTYTGLAGFATVSADFESAGSSLCALADIRLDLSGTLVHSDDATKSVSLMSTGFTLLGEVPSTGSESEVCMSREEIEVSSCTPTCDGGGCADDGCGGTCPCPAGQGCDSAAGQCEAVESCAQPASLEDQTLMQVTVDGVVREYRLSVPETAAGVSLPVIVAFHGGGGRYWPFPQQSAWNNLGAIMAYPLAELLPGNEGEWLLNSGEGRMQDIRFVEALLDDLSARYCVDPKRLYATGYSLGSMFTYELACHLNGRFAAIASYAGSMPLSPQSCVLEDPVAIMHLHGRQDEIIPYASSWDWKDWDVVGAMMDIPSLVTYWAERHACTTESESAVGAASHLVHDDCEGGVRVEHYAIDGQDHEWPYTIGGVSTHQRIWEFFSAFSKP